MSATLINRGLSTKTVQRGQRELQKAGGNAVSWGVFAGDEFGRHGGL